MQVNTAKLPLAKLMSIELLRSSLSFLDQA